MLGAHPRAIIRLDRTVIVGALTRCRPRAHLRRSLLPRAVLSGARGTRVAKPCPCHGTIGEQTSGRGRRRLRFQSKVDKEHGAALSFDRAVVGASAAPRLAPARIERRRAVNVSLADLSLRTKLGLASFLALLGAIAVGGALSVAGYYQEPSCTCWPSRGTGAGGRARDGRRAAARGCRAAAAGAIAARPGRAVGAPVRIRRRLLAEYRSFDLRSAPPGAGVPAPAGHSFRPIYLETSQSVWRAATSSAPWF